MFDISAILAVIAGVGLLFVAAAVLGSGTEAIVTGLFPSNGKDQWPRGVQEMDAPRFAVEHLDALRPARDGGASLAAS